MLREIILAGQQSGELRTDMTVNELSKLYALCERGLMYDWCICNGDYSLKSYSAAAMAMFLEQFRTK